MLTLGIESSCDDTAAAVLENGRVLASVLSSQDRIHEPFGGVVPELASRMHLQAVHPMVLEALSKANKSLSEIDLIAVTRGPGLIGSLLVGYSYAKALAAVTGTPFIGVDHMTGHILSVALDQKELQFPYVALIVSGGTSSLFLAKSTTSFTLLGRTRDDAAGEAFDKVAKLLQLPYPGGPHVSAAAATGNGQAIAFPRAWLSEDSLDFSFSGLKTAVALYAEQHHPELDALIPDICASFQEAVVDVLVEKAMRAVRQTGVQSVVLGGGVSSNLRLRQAFMARCQEEDLALSLPKPQYCTDNAAMIAFAGRELFLQHGPTSFEDDVYSRSPLGS